MMRTARLLMFLCLVTLLPSCMYHVAVIIPTVVPEERHGTWVNGFLFNLVGGETNTGRFCGERPVARIDTKRSFWNLIVGYLTIGIYTPMYAHITCGRHVQPQVIYAPPMPPQMMAPQAP